MKQPSLKFIVLVAALLIVLTTGWAYRRAQQALAHARALAPAQGFLPTKKTALAPLKTDGLTLIQNRQATRGLAVWRDAVWLATDGGLLKLSTSGALQRAYTVLDGLPESDLTAVAVFQEQLWIGTRANGLLAFDGARFTQYEWPEQKAGTITALFNDQSRLLIGTFAGGLLVFDGARFQEIKAKDARLRSVTLIQRHVTRLYVGTFADGLYRHEAARWQHLTTAEDLPSNRVTGVSETDKEVLIATDFGLASTSLSLERAATRVTLPALASLAHWQGRAWLVREDGVLYEYADDPLNPHEWRKPAALTDSRLFVVEDTLWLCHSAGVWRASLQGKRFELAPFHHSAAVLPHNLVAALATDNTDNLWVGTFRHGLAVLDRNGQRIRQLNLPDAQEINAFSFDAAAREMLVASTQGVWRVDEHWQTQSLETPPAQSVTGITHWKQADTRQIALATNRGVAIHFNQQWRWLTMVNGLPANSTYAVLSKGRSLYVGTLSGLVEIQNGHVTRVFTTANSPLTHQWVTALAVVDGRLYVGTYGGGVYALTPAGELVSLKAELGNCFVNPNALASDGTRLIVGTLDGAFIHDTVSQRTDRLTRELPAAQVLSVAADERAYWFGTTNGLLRVEKPMGVIGAMGAMSDRNEGTTDNRQPTTDNRYETDTSSQ
jgi:ligand-binding sensor domain-containing protein